MRYCILRRLKLNDIYDGEDDDDVAHVRVVKATERDTFANSTTLKIDDGCTSKDSRAVDVVISSRVSSTEDEEESDDEDDDDHVVTDKEKV